MTASGLNVSDVVRVDVTISPLAIPVRNFGVPLFVGSSEVIDVYERRRQYTSIDEVADDFLTSTDEYKAAEAFFGQNPQPALAFIGRWAQTATAAILYGGVETPSDQLISNWTSITDGAFFIYVNNVPKSITAMNFSSQTTLNGIANICKTQYRIGSGDASANFQWLAGAGRFKLTSGTTGVDSVLSWAAAPTAWASCAFSKNVANNDTIVVNGVTVKFVTGTPGTDEVLIGADTWTTIQHFLTVCGQSETLGLTQLSYSAVPGVDETTGTIYFVSKVTGTGGNAYTLEEGVDSGSAMTLANLTGDNLTGGSGTDVSALFRLTAARSAPAPVAGIASETPVACAALHADQSHQWYAYEYVTSTQPSDAEHQAVGQAIEAMSPSRIYLYTTGDSTVLDPLTSADLASSMKTLNLARTLGQYSTTAPNYAVASLFGRAANVDFTQNNSTITLKFKREPGIAAEILTETQAATVDDKHCNVFVQYDVDVAIIQQGVMANGDYIDERIGLDWFQNALQTALFNVLYTSPTKVPQTDAGMTVLVNACKTICQQAVFNGLVAPGQWNGPSFGQLITGQALETGWYVFVAPVATQSQADREARKSMPIQIGLKLAGAVHSVLVSVWVNR